MSETLSNDIGTEYFEKFIQNAETYYVDKTRFIKEAIDNTVACALFTRPRRFGKTLWMTTLKSFLEIDPKHPGNTSKQDKLFKDLDIYKEKDFCREYMGQYPVLFISFKNAYMVTNYEAAIRTLGTEIALVSKEFDYLKKSSKLSTEDQKSFLQILNLDTSTATTAEYETTVRASLKTLTYLLKKHFEKDVFLLIDEYDVPFAKLCNTSFYENFKSLYANMLSSALKTNSNLKKSIVTGCLKVAKESIFTDMNAFKAFGLTDDKFRTLLGFTKAEVEQMLAHFNLSSKFRTIKKWYDGYKIGGEEIFCPWDVSNYVLDLAENPKVKPKTYWIHSGSVDIVREIFARTPDLYSENFQKLVKRETIEVKLTEDLNYQILAKVNTSLNSDQDVAIDTSALWTLLFMTGYLTLAKRQTRNGLSTLCVPNECIAECLNDLLKWCFSTKNILFKKQVSPIVKALNCGDTESLENTLSNLLLGHVSIMDHAVKGPQENYYHGFLNGVLSQALQGLVLKYDSNIELGSGRADIAIVLKATNIEQPPVGVIIEIKATKDIEKISDKTKEALDQIESKGYCKGLFGKNPRIKTINAYGIAFCDNDCGVAFKAYHAKATR